VQWHCGPGLYKGDSKDGNMGKIDVLATFDKKKGEPCKVAPIHEWKRKGLFRWERKRIKTDIGGQYAIIATTYGKGRIVLFSPHPENATWLGGYVKELFGWYWWRVPNSTLYFIITKRFL